MTNIIKWLIALLAVSLLYSCGTTTQVQEESARQLSTTAPETTSVDDEEYQIKTGDEIEVLVWEQSSFNTSTTVSHMGTITIPLVGEMEVAGLTKEQLERELERRLSEYIRDSINLTVSIRSTDHMIVSVFGSVERSDNYPIVNETSLFKVLSMAGGPTEDANIRRVKIYRQSGDRRYDLIDLTRYLDSGRMDQTIMVQPGDIVYVPRSQNVVREMSTMLRDVVLLFGIFRVFD